MPDPIDGDPDHLKYLLFIPQTPTSPPLPADTAFAGGAVNPDGPNNAFTLLARNAGQMYTAVDIVFTDTVTAGNESAAYDAETRTLTVEIQVGAGGSTAAQIVSAIDTTAEFTAGLDDAIESNDGTGTLGF